MLMLGRYAGQEIILTVGEETIVVKFVEMCGKQVKLGITASQHVRIDRKEIHDSIMETGFNPEAFPVLRIGDPLVPRK